MAEEIKRPNPNDFYLMNADATQGVNLQGQVFNFADPSTAALTTTPTPTPTPTPSPENQVINTDNRPQQTIDFEAQQIVACIRSGGRWVNGMCVRSPEEGGGGDDDTGETEPVPGSDARMPFDQYMDSLQVNTLESQAYADSLARRLAAIDEQQFAAGQSYQDMYEQAQMSQARRRGLSDVTGFAGGMAEQFGARMSAAEMSALGQIGMGREAAIRGLEMQRMNAPMDAFAEAQAIQEADRTRMLQGIEMQRAQTLFEQAQSGWMQDPETGEWTNIDKETQDMLSLQSINAQQRAETIGEMQYWQAVLADPTQAMMHEGARAALGELQTRYANLLLNNQVMTGAPGSTTPTTTPTPESEPTTENTITTDDGRVVPRVTPADGGVTIATGQNLTGSLNSYVTTKLGGLGITEETDLPNFRNSIRDAEDLAPYIVNLAGDKATEGYDFAQELELVNRYLTNTTQVSKNEFSKLQEAGIIKDGADYYEASHGVDIKTGGTFADFSTDNPANAQFVEDLIRGGYIPRESARVDNGNYTLNISVLQRRANDYTLSWEKLYDDFLRGSLRPIGVSATQMGGYSTYDPRMMG